MHDERVAALSAFRASCADGSFPGDAESALIEEDELERFLERLA